MHVWIVEERLERGNWVADIWTQTARWKARARAQDLKSSGFGYTFAPGYATRVRKYERAERNSSGTPKGSE